MESRTETSLSDLSRSAKGGAKVLVVAEDGDVRNTISEVLSAIGRWWPLRAPKP
jgi:hypothetical protein